MCSQEKNTNSYILYYIIFRKEETKLDNSRERHDGQRGQNIKLLQKYTEKKTINIAFGNQNWGILMVFLKTTS